MADLPNMSKYYPNLNRKTSEFSIDMYMQVFININGKTYELVDWVTKLLKKEEEEDKSIFIIIKTVALHSHCAYEGQRV